MVFSIILFILFITLYFTFTTTFIVFRLIEAQNVISITSTYGRRKFSKCSKAIINQKKKSFFNKKLKNK